MLRRSSRKIAGLMLLAAAWSGVSQATADEPSVAALAIDEPIELDGKLDEPAWRRAAVASGFTQREPDPGAPASEKTEIRILYDDEAVYVGVHAFDQTPEKIIAREMKRDGALFRDDSVIVLLDTFDDDRNTYFFETNPNGARTDSLVTDEGRDTNFEWDGVWDVEARRTSDGWVAEMAIPLTTLRFDPAASQWGLNVRRQIRHKNEEVFWAPILLDADLFRVSLYGSLTGIEGIEPGLDLKLKPFVVVDEPEAVGEQPDEDDDEIDVGLDAKWGITRGLNLDLTINTDFAETEVDNQQINLTRFSLFFPEKREFFLENAGIFEFGPEAGGTPLLKVFHSRRIGVGEGGREIPIEGGARLSGRVGHWNLGALGVATDSVEPTPGSGLASIPDSDWWTLRAKRNVGTRSTVGVIFTDRESGPDFNRVFGADFDWKPIERLAVNGFAARSDDSTQVDGRDWTAGLSAEWSGSIWNSEVAFATVEERFEPGIGFLLRRGVKSYSAETEYEPRPELAGVRNLSFELEAEVITLSNGTTASSEIELEPFGIRFDSEDRFALFVERRFERLFADFEIVPGVTIPTGDYTFYDYGVRFASNSSRRVTFEGSVRDSGFFDGDRLGVDLNLATRPNRFVQTSTDWEYNDIELPGGSFTTNVIRQRVALAFSPRMRTDAFLQYNDVAERFGVNLRFNWIYKPGADLFVVFNQGWDAPDFDNLDRTNRQVIVKFTYLWQR